MGEEFGRLLRAEVEAALGTPPWERLEVGEVTAGDPGPGDWPTAVVLLRDPHRPRIRFGRRASAELPGGDPTDPGWLPTAASLASVALLEDVLRVLRAPTSTADADGVIWF